jgi:hypothetical protein
MRDILTNYMTVSEFGKRRLYPAFRYFACILTQGITKNSHSLLQKCCSHNHTVIGEHLVTTAWRVLRLRMEEAASR